jgi:hypothetical protein
MLGKRLLILGLLLSIYYICTGQVIIKTSDLFPEKVNNPGSGTLNINQPLEIDTLLSRYILSKNISIEPNGYRILIYRNSEIVARKESERIHAEFMNLFPDIPAYREFQAPNYYLVLAGNFRSKTEGIKLLLLVSKKYPYSTLIPYFINYDEFDK